MNVIVPIFEPGGNFAKGAVWYTIAFKVSIISFFGPKLADVKHCSKILSPNLITITGVVENSGFRNTITVCVVVSFTVHNENPEVCLKHSFETTFFQIELFLHKGKDFSRKKYKLKLESYVF